MAQETLKYFDRDGYRRKVIYDRDTPDDFTIHTQVDCDAILDAVKVARELHPTNSVNKVLAKAPMVVYEQSIRENWDEKDWARWLNDPDNAAFRVWKGQV